VTRWCLPGRVWFTFEAEPSRPVSAPVTVLDVTLATGTGLRTDPASTV
jgi:hypothetical protein